MEAKETKEEDDFNKEADTMKLLAVHQEGEKKFSENKSFSSISLKHYDSFLGDLRCPGCANALTVPIKLCVNGHSLCKFCRIRLNSCPVCSDALTDIRSATLEKLVGKYQFPCVNLKNGCFVRLPFELMKKHEKNCVYKIAKCFMGNVYQDCDWKGRESDWYEHCKAKHANKIMRTHEKHLLIWNYEALNTRPGSILAYYIIENYSETFNLYQVYEKKNNIIKWTVIKATKSQKKQKEKPSQHDKFAFEIELFCSDNDHHLCIQRFPVHLQNTSDFLDDGKCVRLGTKDVERFLDEEKNLHYYVNIIAEKGRRVDELIETAKKQQHRLSTSIIENTEDFFDFDSSTDTDNLSYVIIDEDKLKSPDDDIIKSAFEREFNRSARNSLTTPNIVQKPPRSARPRPRSASRSRSTGGPFQAPNRINSLN